MSEANLIGSKYALDLRDIRLSNDKREILEGFELDLTNKGLIDLSEFNDLSKFSAYLQEGKDDNEQRLFSTGNLNLFILNDRIRLRLIEIFSDLLEVNILDKIDQFWENRDHEGKELVEDLYNAVFFSDDAKPTIDEILRFWFSYNNPSHLFYSNTFYGEDQSLEEISQEVNELLKDISSELPEIDEGEIFNFLTTPEKLFPDSIKEQIDYIVKNWGKYLSKEELNFLLLGKDLLKEEEKFRGFGGPGPAEVYEFGMGKASFQKDGDLEKFSQDQHWMPRLVLLAKNIHVWLNQLSNKYQKDISTLSDIPDEELDLLMSRGITGLWLVGIWERSNASKKIKNKTGSPDALASAYSIYDYVIAEDLGGKEAYDSLKLRLKKRNIRMGADMVPNHMGIDSKWIREHPDWFIQADDKPFESYSYNGEDLSDTDEIEIYLEDHYYDQSDAAVTFKRVDPQTGEELYIYHGNDGTSFPWNDTAQIDFLNNDAREAVIQTIVNVAKQFPIIRFDAAMVLAKQHIRRLWYPAPGEGGDIPSRSHHSMSDEEFNEAIPNEFWREVVDRVNQEAPDTLLLAEAFWLLEGYFVRTLGMHRVYNSAFMKMLQQEENAKYRQTIKNVLEYDPEILKRFVNYLTTPDEDPAIQGFGSDDKYFGITTMMATMPGLPMFGHGQFEGYSEKYGMEFEKSQLDENINYGLVDRHEMEIVPLLKKRYLFANSDNFYLYDFFTSEGGVNENVYAYSNRYEGEKALVIYNNVYENAAGWVKRSVAFSEKLNNKTTRLRQVDLFEGLDLSNGEGFLLFKDHVSGLEYIRSKDEIREKGLYVEVGAFKYHVFVDMKEVYDNQGIWSEVATQLDGKGIDNIQALYNEIDQPREEMTTVEEQNVVEPTKVTPAEKEKSTTILKVEISELKEENEALKGQIEAMSAELENYQEDVQKLKRIKQENESLQNSLDQLKAENNQLKSQLKEIQTPTTEEGVVSKLEDENKQLNDQLAAEISANAKFERKIETLESQIEKLEEELRKEQSSDKVNQLSSKVKTLEAQLEDAESESKGFRQQLQQTVNEKSNLKSQVENMQAKNEELQTRVQQVEGEKKSLKDELEASKTKTSSRDTLLSSVLLETIKSRLEDATSGIKLRNLAMSLGISASVCLDHVKTMEDKGQVEIKYSSTDDSNPLITSKMV